MLVDPLKNGDKDVGFKYTREMTTVQTDYAVDKITRTHPEAAQALSVLDAGAGGGYMGVL